MLKINYQLKPEHLASKIQRLWELSAAKILSIEKNYDWSKGAPVYTVQGKYTSRGWTEWTRGFQWGAAILQYDATSERDFLEIGRKNTTDKMTPQVTHSGVHDHGFNNISTYGNLLRLMNEGRMKDNESERNFYQLALKCSAAVQTKRWSKTNDGAGYIYSFNGPHSLFADTIRTLRSLAVGFQLGHVLMDENEKKISLLERLIQHARITAKYIVYYGKGRDIYDVRGRVAHEAIFNIADGTYRCPNSQQGYSPFTTWTRGLAWIICGFAEELEFLDTITDEECKPYGGRQIIADFMLQAARAASDFYIEQTPTDGIPYWDTGAPLLEKIGDYLNQPADPFNEFEPVDSSAAAIAAQGLLRLGHYLKQNQKSKEGNRYWQAGITVLNTLLEPPYLNEDANHQGLILHSIYHRPNGWDHIPEGQKVPCGESSMWGDYHTREAALYIQRINQGESYLTFWPGKT